MKKIFLIILCFGLMDLGLLYSQEVTSIPSPIMPSVKSLSPLEQAFQNPKFADVQPTYWMHDSTWYSQWVNASSTWLLNEREFLSYNGTGFMTQDLYLTLNTSQQWENFTRYFNSFGTTGNVLSNTGQTWNNVTDLWVDFMFSHYDAIGRIDTSWYKQFDHVNNVFISGSQNIYSYNTSNLMTELLSQTLDIPSGSWVNISKISYTYNSGNMQTEQLSVVWSTSQNNWVNDQKYEYSYDAGNHPTGYLYSTWNTGTHLWEPNTLATYTNSTGGLPLEKLYQHWLSSTSSWQNYEKIANQYNSYNLMTDDLDQLWNTGTSLWINNWKDQYVYYSNNVQKTRNQYYWIPNGSSWMESYYTLNDSIGYMLEYYMKSIDFQNSTYIFGDRYLYSYNTQHNYIEYDHFSLDIPSGNWIPSGRRQFTYDQNANNTVQLDQIWDIGSNSYLNYYKIENFFSFTTGIREKKDLSGYCFYPNPIRKGMPVSCQGLKANEEYSIMLYNLNGQLIFTSPIHSGEQFIFPGNIAPGMYLLTLSLKNRLITTGKVVVKA